MLTKTESDKIFMFCMEELRLLKAEGNNNAERLSNVIEQIELLYRDSQEEIPYYEQRIIDLVKDRVLNVGLKNYGEIDSKRIKNTDFLKESLEEVVDSIVYLTAKLIQLSEVK